MAATPSGSPRTCSGVRGQMSESGCWVLGAGCWVLGCWVLGCWVLEPADSAAFGYGRLKQPRLEQAREHEAPKHPARSTQHAALVRLVRLVPPVPFVFVPLVPA